MNQSYVKLAFLELIAEEKYLQEGMRMAKGIDSNVTTPSAKRVCNRASGESGTFSAAVEDVVNRSSRVSCVLSSIIAETPVTPSFEDVKNFFGKK